jgi:transcriptional antiterminator NusG
VQGAIHGPESLRRKRVAKMIEKENQSQEESENESSEPESPAADTISGAGDLEFVDADDVVVDENESDEVVEEETEVSEPESEEETPESEPESATPETEEEAVEEEPEVDEPAVIKEEEAIEEKAEAKKPAEPVEVAVPGDAGPPKKWYVVHTYSGHENKVKENISKMIKTSPAKSHFGQIIVPTEEVAEMKKGKKTITTKKFFPSYILIEMFMTDEARHLVSDIPGVTSFVGTTSGPQSLSKTEVDRILGRMDKEKQTIIPDIPFTLGEHIRIKDGPFSDFTGIIDEINAERGKLKVLVSIFGRETPVELDFLQVENL